MCFFDIYGGISWCGSNSISNLFLVSCLVYIKLFATSELKLFNIFHGGAKPLISHLCLPVSGRQAVDNFLRICVLIPAYALFLRSYTSFSFLFLSLFVLYYLNDAVL